MATDLIATDIAARNPAKFSEPELSLLAINLTRRCNLSCKHCYLDASNRGKIDPDELSTVEVMSLLDQVAVRSNETMVVLTGGEPLLRMDVEDIIRHGNKLGLFMVLGTNGMLLTEKRVTSLKEAGLAGAGISLDSLDPDYHDNFRNLQGGWEKTLIGIEECRRQELSFQLHFSITEQNASELSAMVEFSEQVGARVLNVFFLVCTGRGEKVSDISPHRYEQLLREIILAQEQHPNLIIKPKCAPHYKRVAHQFYPDSSLNQISGNEGDGCIAGRHYCRITPTGNITACPYIEQPTGNIRHQNFWSTWDNSAQFQSLRKPKLAGKCGKCEYQHICGGCRARPLAQGEGLFSEDSICNYQPQGSSIITPLIVQSKELTWSQMAQQRLQRIPGFVRKMVKKRAEVYVTDLGEKEVTIEHLNELVARRFGKNRPQFFTNPNNNE